MRSYARRAVVLEIEAKFGVPDEETFRRLLETTVLAGFDLGKASVEELSDRYLDTAGRAIQNWGYACRLRRKEDGYVATLKGLGRAAEAVHRRIEHEVDLSKPVYPQDWPPSAARDLALRLCGCEPLVVLYDIDQTRHNRVLVDGGRAVAILSLDRVRVCRNRVVASSYLELEAELLPEGKEDDLRSIVAELVEEWNLVPERQSKFERALALFPQGMVLDTSAERGAPARLSKEERVAVEHLALERDVIARRARVLLAWDDGLSREEMAQRSGLSHGRVRYWVSQFSQKRMSVFPPEAVARVTEDWIATPAASEGEAGGGVGQPIAEDEAATVARPTSREEAPRQHRRIELLDKPGIEPDDPMSEAGRKILRFHFRRMLYNEPGTRLGEDVEALHDMRVATRRMRAALRVFGEYYLPKAAARYSKGLKRTGRALGAARDLDVFRGKTQDYVDTLSVSEQGGLDDFISILERQRETARKRMLVYLDSKKYLRFTDRFGRFVETEGMDSLEVTLDGHEPRPYHVRYVAPMAVFERLANMRAYDEWVTIPSPPVARLHALRIACKRLRYTLEFFSEVLGPDTKELIKEVVVMQDHLGDLQDAVVASAILRDYLNWGTWGRGGMRRPRPSFAAPVIAPGVAAYLAAKQSELQHLLETFPQEWQRLTGPGFSQRVADAVSVL
jgi:CHAD domain-containing protein